MTKLYTLQISKVMLDGERWGVPSYLTGMDSIDLTDLGKQITGIEFEIGQRGIDKSLKFDPETIRIVGQKIINDVKEDIKKFTGVHNLDIQFVSIRGRTLLEQMDKAFTEGGSDGTI